MEDKVKAAKLVKYEWDMFAWTIDRCFKEAKGRQGREQWMLLEDMLLHARVLRDFLTRPPKGDDISAAHFVEDIETWRKQASSLCPYLRVNRKRLNKKLAHLTYARLTEDELWEPIPIRDELQIAWDKFLSSVPEKSKEWFTGPLE